MKVEHLLSVKIMEAVTIGRESFTLKMREMSNGSRDEGGIKDSWLHKHLRVSSLPFCHMFASSFKETWPLILGCNICVLHRRAGRSLNFNFCWALSHHAKVRLLEVNSLVKWQGQVGNSSKGYCYTGVLTFGPKRFQNTPLLNFRKGTDFPSSQF